MKIALKLSPMVSLLLTNISNNELIPLTIETAKHAATSAKNAARISAVEADSTETMGEFTRNLEKGGAAAQSVGRFFQILKSLGVGNGK